MALDKRNPFSSFRSREKEVEIEEEEIQVKAKPRARRPTPPAPKPEQLTQRANTPSGLPPAPSPTRTSARPKLTKPVKTSAPAPAPKAEAQPKRRGRKEGLTVNSASSAFTTSTPPSAPSGYSSLYGLPSLSNYTSTSNAPAQKNKIIPALRAAGQRKLDKGEARSLDQGTALEIVGKIVGKNVTINDIEKEKKANTQALFASPTELVTLYELAMRMVESHQFYTRAV